MYSQEILQEDELVKEYENVQKKLWEFGLLMNNSGVIMKPEQQEEYKQATATKAQLEERLINFKYAISTTDLRVSMFKRQTQVIIENLQPDEKGLTVTSNQGSMFSKDIYRKVNRDIVTSLGEFSHFVVTTPYIRTRYSGFDSSELIEYLTEFKQTLNTHPPQNYIELEAVVIKAIEDIEEMQKQNANTYASL